MAINTKKYIETYLKIKDKKARIIPITLNLPQSRLYDALGQQYAEGKPQRAIVLKARQMGMSTVTEAIIFKKTATAENINSGIVAHEATATTNLFNMFKRYYDNLPAGLQPEQKASNAKELIFSTPDNKGLNSAIKCMTAGNTSIGRSDTFQNLHISEYAYWQGDKAATLQGLLQAVPRERDTLVIVESTANGYDDFKDMWDAAVNGENDFAPVFCAWWEMQEYSLAPLGEFQPTSEEQKLIEAYDLTPAQISWRRWCIKNNCRGSVDIFKQEYPSCPEEAFLFSGKPVFDNQKIIDRIAYLTKLYADRPYMTAHFGFSWRDPEARDMILDGTIELVGTGDIRIYRQPEAGHPYVIGGDTKGEGTDFYAVTVIDNTTGERVAVLHMESMSSVPFTHQLYCLGRYYNDALIGVEINFNTAPVEELTRLKYPHQYVRQKYDSYTKETQKKYGWKTDGNTRPLIIDKEIDLISNNIELFNDIDMLKECMSFVYDDNGRPDAMDGKHDDILFSDMIANEIRGQQTFSVKKPKGAKAVWEADMYEDYRNASSEDKKMLIERWGNPW